MIIEEFKKCHADGVAEKKDRKTRMTDCQKTQMNVLLHVAPDVDVACAKMEGFPFLRSHSGLGP